MDAVTVQISPAPISHPGGRRWWQAAMCKPGALAQASAAAIAANGRAVGRVVRLSPGTVLLPLALVAALLALGVWGMTSVANREADNARALAASLARDTAAALYGELVKTYGLMTSLAAVIKYSPQWEAVSNAFPAIAPTLWQQAPQGSLDFVEVIPNGIVRAMYPPDSPDQLSVKLQVDIYSDPTLTQVAALAIMTNSVTLFGPFWSNITHPEGRTYVGFVLPVFISNVSSVDEDFGSPIGLQAKVCPNACYDPVKRTKVWGAVAAAMNTDFLKGSPHLVALRSKGYAYQLVAPAGQIPLIAGEQTLQGSDVFEAPIPIPNGEWLLLLAPLGSLRPSWYVPVLATVIIGACAIPLLLFAALVSRAQHQTLLTALLPKSMIAEMAREASAEGGASPGVSWMPFRLTSDTPADLIVDMMGGLLESEVASALMQQLGQTNSPRDAGGIANADPAAPALLDDNDDGGDVPGDGLECAREQPGAYEDIHGALTLLMAPQPVALEPPASSRRRSVEVCMDTPPHSGRGTGTGAGSVDAAGAATAADAGAAAAVQRQPHSNLISGNHGLVHIVNAAVARVTHPPSAAPSGGLTSSGADVATDADGSITPTKLTDLMTAAALKAPTPAVVEQAERLLAAADGSWQLDTFALYEATQGHALSCLGYFLMHRAGLIKHFNINPAVLARYLRHIESGYLDNPYHNAIHATDVLRSLHVILHQAHLTAHYVDHVGLMAAYMAAIVHDYGHLGLTNDYLVATKAALALRYNDRAPMENHHCAAAFIALQQPGLNFLENVPDHTVAALRKMVIEMVLATDMKQHFGIISHFKTVHRLGNVPMGGGRGPRASADTDMGRGGSASPANSATGRGGLGPAAPKPGDDAERLLGLQVALKAADLGHLTAPLPVHKRWLERLEEEFFRQGDKEREAGMPISPLFDRAKQGASKSQVGFYDFVALPLLSALVGAFPGANPMMENALANYRHWKIVEEEAKQSSAAAPPQAASK